MPIRTFLVHNGIEASRENIVRWRKGWTLTELRIGHEYIREWFEAELVAYKSEKNNNWHQIVGWYSESII